MIPAAVIMEVDPPGDFPPIPVADVPLHPLEPLPGFVLVIEPPLMAGLPCRGHSIYFPSGQNVYPKSIPRSEGNLVKILLRLPGLNSAAITVNNVHSVPLNRSADVVNGYLEGGALLAILFPGFLLDLADHDDQ